MFHISGLIQHVVSPGWLLSLSIMIILLWSAMWYSVVTCISSLFLSKAEQCSFLWCTTFVYPFTSCWIWFLAIRNNAAKIIHVQVCGPCFHMSWIDIRNEIAGSCGEFTLGFLGNSQTLREWLHHLHSYQQCMRVPVSLCPAPTCAIVFFIKAIVMDVKLYIMWLCLQFLNN